MKYLNILLLQSFSFTAALGLLLTSFISIISVSNPLSAMPIFTNLTEDNTKQERIYIAKRASFYMFLILTLFLLAGTYIKDFFGISMAGIRVAGGLIILNAAWMMLTPGKERMTEEGKKSAKDKNDISFSPLALPLMAGPGTISVVIGLSSGTKQVLDYVVILAAILISAIVSYFVLRMGPIASRRIGPVGMDAITRLMGFIVMAIAVQFILTGIQDFFATNPAP